MIKMAEEFLASVRKDTETADVVAHQLITLQSHSLTTQAESAKKFLKNNVILSKAINHMGETIADMDEEIEEKDNKITFLQNKIGISDKAVVKEMTKLNIKISDVDRNQRILKRLKITDDKHKMIK